jgi:hypothetical protein
VLQKLLELPQQLLGEEAGNSSSSSEAAEARAAQAFAWLLGQRQQLLVCPDEATAKAVFQAVWCSSSREVAQAAYTNFLGWCGMSDSQSGNLQCYRSGGSCRLSATADGLAPVHFVVLHNNSTTHHNDACNMPQPGCSALAHLCCPDYSSCKAACCSVWCGPTSLCAC